MADGVWELFGSLMSPAGANDPYPLYAKLRAHGPLVEAQPGMLIATSYATVDEVLRDPALGVEPAPGALERSILATNPPDHTRMRRPIAAAFTPRRIGGLRSAIQAQATSLLDGLPGHSADLMAEFAYQLPVGVICELLGVPHKDRTWFRPIAQDVAAALEFNMTPETVENYASASELLLSYFASLVELKTSTPEDDLISDLAKSEALTPAELLRNLALLLIAGFETTTNLIGNGVMALLRHPDQLARLKAQPELTPAFIEEFLRYDPPVQVTSRVALQPTVVDGQRIEAGTYVVALIGSANRDEARFPGADRFDPDRPDNTPISFGAGAHFCLGAALARMEGQVAFPLLLERLDGLRLESEPVRRDRLVLRGYETLPVTWNASSSETAPRR